MEKIIKKYNYIPIVPLEFVKLFFTFISSYEGLYSQLFKIIDVFTLLPSSLTPYQRTTILENLLRDISVLQYFRNLVNSLKQKYSIPSTHITFEVHSHGDLIALKAFIYFLIDMKTEIKTVISMPLALSKILEPQTENDYSQIITSIITVKHYLQFVKHLLKKHKLIERAIKEFNSVDYVNIEIDEDNNEIDFNNLLMSKYPDMKEVFVKINEKNALEELIKLGFNYEQCVEEIKKHTKFSYKTFNRVFQLLVSAYHFTFQPFVNIAFNPLDSTYNYIENILFIDIGNDYVRGLYYAISVTFPYQFMNLRRR